MFEYGYNYDFKSYGEVEVYTINNGVESECTTYTHGNTEEYSITMSSTYSEATNLANLIRTLYGEVKLYEFKSIHQLQKGYTFIK